MNEREKLLVNLGGVRDMQRPPDAVFVVDLKTEAIAVREAERLKIPLIALVDTNCDPDPVDYVIPGNDDAIRSCKVVVEAISGVVAEQHARFRAEEEQAQDRARGAGAPRGRGAGAPRGRGGGRPQGRRGGRLRGRGAGAARAGRAGGARARAAPSTRTSRADGGHLREGRQGAARAHRRRDHGRARAPLQEAGGRHGQGDRRPAHEGPGEGRQARRARRLGGPRGRATSTTTARSACSSRSTARPTSWRATRSSRRSCARWPSHVAASAPRVRVRGRGARGGPRRRAQDLPGAGRGGRQAAPRSRRRSPRAACASGSRRSSCSTRRT